MIKFFQILAMVIIALVVVALFIVVIVFGTNFIMEYIPCEFLSYTLAGLLFIAVALCVIMYAIGETKIHD